MGEWTSGDVDVNGVRLHYHRTGGGGRPLILLHGFSDSGLCWTRVARDLETDYDVVMPDARGHGRSDRGGAAFDAAQRARDAAELIRSLGLEQVALAGHSMGAQTAAEIAATEHELTACVILEDPPWRDATQTTAGRWDYIRRAQELPREEVPAYCRQLHPTWDDAEVEPWVDAKRQFDLSLLEAPRPGSSRPWREIVAAIRCPTLLLTADPDLGAIVTPEAGTEAARLARGRVERIAGAGHNIRREQYPAYRAAFTGFLHQVYPPAGVRAEEAT
ncbi:MAG: alpha/beta hydrolase [Candidatus Dormibacteraeota bacterium]|nr:alpha/beta hydrolase [Candidatus Dormibacteraeota bacterium]MBO0745486.1 alpha/beta hydrolase [Candidatus Dormibacteraeota bacterium]